MKQTIYSALRIVFIALSVFGIYSLADSMFHVPRENAQEIEVLKDKLDKLSSEKQQTQATVTKEVTIIRQIQYGYRHPRAHYISQWMGNKLK